MTRYAVVDIGTNTCNLLIANILADGSFETIYDRKLPVKLGRGGIHNNILLPDAIDRGIAALQNHAETIRSYHATRVRVIGTSALRGAANRDEFLNKVRALLGWEIDIIDGDQEASLIYRGVRLSLQTIKDKYLIVDIGGGSIEFILANEKGIIWEKSFNIGIARALESISMSDPLSFAEIATIEQWFDSHLEELYKICNLHQPDILIGCSGAFDSFMDIYEKVSPDLKIRKVSELPLEAYGKIHELLVKSDHESRSKMEGMDKMRVEMIVVASVFTNFILQKLQIKKLIHTHYSLKEGVMDQLISNEY